MAEHIQDNILVRLGDADLTVADPSQDVRNRSVIDQHDEPIGHVSGLFIDKDEKKVRMLQVAAGGFLGLGERHFLIPVEAISSITHDEVHINQTRERIVRSPAYDPSLTEVLHSRDFWEPYYGYYGYTPYWGAGIMGRGNLGTPVL